MRISTCAGSLTGAVVIATLAIASASAQVAYQSAPDNASRSWDVQGDDPLGTLMVRIGDTAAEPFSEAGAAYEARLSAYSAFTPASSDETGLAVTTRQDVWLQGSDFDDRLRLRTIGTLRRADGAPIPLTPTDRAALDAEAYDVSYVRGWRSATAYTASGLEVSLTPHAGIGLGSRGGSAEAGATLRIGQGLSDMVPEGQDAFGDRGRWYIYAAGSGRAVGYNFARDRDGDYARSGVSHDSGSFLGDASVGVAWRRGDMQSSFGLVYREVEAEGLRAGRDFDSDVSEGLIAFQLSIKPE